MAKQMHTIDDNEEPGKNGFWQRQGKEPPAPFLDQSLSSGSDPAASASGAGDEELGMGRKNPFENWRVNASAPTAQEPAAAKAPKPAMRAGSIIWHTFSTVVLAGVVAATLFTIWMPSSFIPKGLNQRAAEAESSGIMDDSSQLSEGTLPPDFPSNRVGLVVGHRGHDSGAVCANGLTELEINSNVATYLQQKLIKKGFEVDLLDEFDPRLSDYKAALLLSIHADSCDYINDSATGFKVAAAFSQKADQSSNRLVDCIADRYAKVTGLRYHYQSVTTDMTQYHIFDEINPYTTAGIIELGFMNLDQDVLMTKPEMLAEGVAQGIGCYMNNEEAQRP